MLIWICGVPGSGKTTLGRALYQRLKPTMPLFMLDGDDFRRAIGDALGYSPEDRVTNALRIARFSHLLDSQGINVVCCAVTLPAEVQRLNRENCRGYCEVFLDVTRETVMRRDPKRLYRHYFEGTEHNLPGIDIDYQPPASPHVIIDNNKDEISPDHLVDRIVLAAFPETVTIAGAQLRR